MSFVRLSVGSSRIEDEKLFSLSVEDGSLAMTALKELPIERSKTLLLENLSESQRVEFLRNEQFTVEADGQKYHLKKDITVKSDGTRLCAISPGLPVYDQMLARKLALENAPDLFLSVANNLSVPYPLYGSGAGFGSVEGCFEVIRLATTRAFVAKGFIKAKLRLTLERSLEHHGLMMRVAYGQYYVGQLVDVNHLLYGNLWDALEPIVYDMVEMMTREIIKRAGD